VNILGLCIYIDIYDVNVCVCVCVCVCNEFR
jgi:hypothetical protein